MRPVLRLRSLTRLNACPFPGFTYSLLNMAQGSLSSMTLRPFLNSLVLNVDMFPSRVQFSYIIKRHLTLKPCTYAAVKMAHDITENHPRAASAACGTGHGCRACAHLPT